MQQMNAGDWAVIIASSGGAVSAFVAALGYRHQARGHRAETDVRLVTAFAELVPIANARGPAVLAEPAASRIAEWAHKDDSLTPVQQSDLLGGALALTPVGAQTQLAVIRAIASLGCEHAILWEASKAAVQEVSVHEEHQAHKSEALRRLETCRPRGSRTRA